MPRTRELFDGMKPFVICAAVLFVFGVFTILLELQSASFVQWDGIKVHGDTYRGVTSYTYKGENYTIDDPAISVNDTRHLPTTVWLSRSDPTDSEQAFIESPWDRWTDFVFFTGFFFAGLLFLAFGFIRALLRRRRRDVALLQEQFGTGLDPEVVDRLLAQRRLPPRTVDIEDE